MLRTSPRHIQGFNLIEVMTVVAVLTLLLGVGVPSVAEWIRNTHVRSLAESLQAGLQKARNEALRRNRVVTLWLVTPAAGLPDASCALSSDSGSWVVSLDAPAGPDGGLCHITPSDTVAPRIIEVQGAGPNASGITVAGLDRSGNPASSISFNGLGAPTATSTPLARIDLTHTQSGARQLSVQISAAGSVRMCDRDVAASDPRACN